MKQGVAGLMALVACASTGCVESAVTRINDSTYRVKQVTTVTDLTRIGMMYTAASLTLEHGYDLMLLEPMGEKQKPESYVRSASLTRSLPFGWIARQNTLATTGNGADWRPRSYPGSYKPITIITGTAAVSLYKKPLPDDLMAAIDARQLKDSLQPFFDSKGQARLPEMWKLVRQSTVAHVRITLPTADLVRPAFVDAPPKPGIGADKDLRDAAEFVDQFDAAESEMYGWYESRRRQSGVAKGGTVTLALTVAPGGQVTESRVVSSTLDDAVFVDGLRRMAAKFPFFREEVLATRAAAIPIVFTPQ